MMPALLALPIWPWVVAQSRVPVDLETQFVGGGHLTGLLIGLTICAVMFALLCRASRYVLALVPLAALAPIEGLYILKYGQPTNAMILGVVAATHAREVVEFISGVVSVALGLTMGLVVLGVLSWRWLCRNDIVWEGSARGITLTTVVVVGAVALWHDGAYGTASVERSDERRPSDVLPPLARALEKTWPLGVPVRFAEYRERRARILSAQRKAADFRFGATAESAPATVVLVIGESIRADHLHLNGYTRDTTPRLGSVEGLVSYRRALALAGATRESVPYMLTRRAPGIDPATLAPERTIVSAFREAGFDTWWVSTQAPLGDLEDQISAFAEEAHHRRFVNPAGYAKRAALDEEAVSALRDALRTPSAGRLVVMHLLQAHWDYRYRYPPSFDVFHPSGQSGEIWSVYSRGEKASIVNAYDNSVLYADHVLAEIIEALRQLGGPAALVYMSDHGQALFEGRCLTAGHGIASHTVFDVPLLAWVSPELARRHPEKAAALASHRDRPVTAESVFPTLVDLGGLRMPGDKRDLSLANPRYTPGRRIVTLDTRSWIDADRGLAARDCAAPR